MLITPGGTNKKEMEEILAALDEKMKEVDKVLADTIAIQETASREEEVRQAQEIEREKNIDALAESFEFTESDIQDIIEGVGV